MAVNPPRPSLPPLNALRAFESAARLGGFKQASGELNVTPGAVAQHVKFLEAWCGAPLFERRPQGVELTPLGQRVLPDFVAAFDAISFASQRLRTEAAPKNVSIATLPSVSQLLLAVWMPLLREAVDGVQISVTAMEEPPNLAREPFDLSLFFERGVAESLTGKDALIPVCAPSVKAGIAELDGLMSAPHISDQSWPDDWRTWFAEVYPGTPYSGTGPSFSLFSVAVQEAVHGAGILMAHRSLVAPLLQKGDLVAAVDVAVPIDLALVLKKSPVSSGTRVLTRLCDALAGLAQGALQPNDVP